jgi:hypothetical protein
MKFEGYDKGNQLKENPNFCKRDKKDVKLLDDDLNEKGRKKSVKRVENIGLADEGNLQL